MLDLYSLLAARDGAHLAGWRGDAPVTVAELRARVAAWHALCAATPGQACALYLADSLEFSAALLGAWRAGKTVWLTADTLEASCASLAESVDAFLGEFPAAYQPLLPQGQGGVPEPAPMAEIALVVHTSGSTGTPQAIPKKLAQLLAEVATLEALFGPAIGDAAIVTTVSHQHIYGLLFKVLWPLAAGRPVHANSISYPEQLEATLAQRPSVLVASPAHLKRLPEHLAWDAAAAQLRMVFSSGGPLAPDAGDLAARLLGHVPTEIYGSSETGGIAWRRRHASTAGMWEALPGVEWRQAEGLLEVRSPHLFEDTWLRLQDRVNPAADGRFMLLGRSDRVVKIEEKRISLDAIEAAVLACGLAVEARVIAAPARQGEREVLAAFVVLNEAGRALLAAEGKSAVNARLRAQVASVVEAVALPRRWRYPEQMPIDATGKTTRALLLAQLGAVEERPRVPHACVLEKDGNRVLLALTVPANLFYFDGHFTDAPVLPGVAQVDWAILYGRKHFRLAPDFAGIHALKFQQVIRPDAPVSLELIHDSVKGSLQFRYFSDAGPHAGGRIQFAASSPSPTEVSPC
ncbi:MAG: AMP-binding protein [Gammaproteobacteria bacterium]